MYYLAFKAGASGGEKSYLDGAGKRYDTWTEAETRAAQLIAKDASEVRILQEIALLTPVSNYKLTMLNGKD